MRLVSTLLIAALAHQGWAAELPPIEKDLLVPGATAPNDAGAVATWMAGNGWETSDPFYARVHTYLTQHASDHGGKKPISWSKKYYDYAIDFLGRCQRIETALADRPDEFRRLWLEYYAERLISYRIDYDMDAVMADVAAIPTDGDYLAISSQMELLAELEQRYGWSSLDGAVQRRYGAALAGINGGLIAAGGRSGPADDTDSRLLAGDDSWRNAYRIVDGSTLLFPAKQWLSSQSHFSPDTLDVTISTGPIEHLFFGLEGAGPQGELVQIRLDIQAGSVVSAIATLPGTDNKAYPVYPLWAADLELGLHPKEKSDDDHMASEAPADDLGLDLLEDEAETRPPQTTGPLRWFHVHGSTVTGAGRIHFKWGKQSKLVHQFHLTATIDGDQISGSFRHVRPGDSKRRKPTLQPEAAVTPVAAPAAGDAITSRWSTQFGNDGMGTADGGGETIDSGSDAELVWISDRTVPHSRGPNTRGNMRPQEPGMPLSGGWSSPLIDNGLVFLNYYKPAGDLYVLGAQPVPGDPIESSRFDMMRLHCDEYLHAFDAATGTTAWRLRIAQRGINWMSFNKGGPGSSAGVGNGLVVWVSSIGEVFAADQKTGKLRWSNSIGLRHELMVEEIRLAELRNDLYGSRNDFQGAVVIADGVAVVPDHMFNKGGGKYRYEVGNGLIGFDLKTGEEMWRLPEICGSSRFQQGAQIWRHDGKAYVLASNNSGTALIDPATGSVIDRAEGLVNRHWGLTMGPDIVVGDLLSDPKDHRSPATPAGFSLSPSGFAKRWSLDAKYQARTGGGSFTNGRLYLQSYKPFTGVICVDPDNGAILAEEPCNIGGGEHSPFMVATGDKLIVAMDRTNGLILIDSDPATMTGSAKPWIMSLATGYCGSVVPAVADGRMVIRTPDRLLSYDLRED